MKLASSHSLIILQNLPLHQRLCERLQHQLEYADTVEDSDCSTTLHMLVLGLVCPQSVFFTSPPSPACLPARPQSQPATSTTPKNQITTNRSNPFSNSCAFAVTSHRHVPAASGELSVIHLRERRPPRLVAHSPACHLVIQVHVRLEVGGRAADVCCRARSTAKSLTKSAMLHKSISKKGV